MQIFTSDSVVIGTHPVSDMYKYETLKSQSLVEMWLSENIMKWYCM